MKVRERLIRLTPDERTAIRNAFVIEALDDLSKLRLTKAQLLDIADRAVNSGRIGLNSRGEIEGSAPGLLIDEIREDAPHLFRDLSAPEPDKGSDLPASLARMTSRQKLDYANAQAFADERRKAVRS